MISSRLKKRINQITNLIGLIGFIIFLYLGYALGEKYYHLHYYEETTYGTIDSIKYDRYDDMTIYYTYKVNNTKYNNTHIRRDNPQKLPEVGDSFQVRYSHKKPEISEMIIK